MFRQLSAAGGDATRFAGAVKFALAESRLRLEADEEQAIDVPRFKMARG